MLTVAEAEELVCLHLGASARADHSRCVARAMSRLAKWFRADEVLWQVVGLCHDLDFEVTRPDRSQHGLLTIEWLKGRLPDEALMAIAAHDHRTGVGSDTLVADTLKLADVLAVLSEHLGPRAAEILGGPDVGDALASALPGRSYVAEMLLRLAAKHGLDFTMLAEICGSPLGDTKRP